MTTTIMDINMVDIFSEYDIPEDIPEWLWIEKVASYKHCHNNTLGIWEFMLNLSREFNDIPETLKETFDQAYADGFGYILFHQGT
jgi:hypothetical protein